jgi:hypothetical protein
LIIGCDFHSRFQQIAMVDTETGELLERRLEHGNGEAKKFYAELQQPVRVGMEATGYAQWFERMITKLGQELSVGDAAAIRAAMVRKQKTDSRDALHILDLLLANRFPRIWIPSPEERDVRQLLRHRHKLVCLRTSLRNQLQALAMGQGVCRKKKLDAPFQWNKQVASHYGGTANGLVISWPVRIKNTGQMRTQWHHVIDIVPTIYEAVGVSAPSSVNGVDQKAIEGVSMVYTFDHPDVPSTRTKQYFEMLGNRGIYSEGWIACTTPPSPPLSSGGADVDPITGYKWELYDLTKETRPKLTTLLTATRKSSSSFSFCFTRKPLSTTCFRSTTAKPYAWDPAFARV